MANSEPNKTEQGIEVRLEWAEATELTTIYANHLYITHSGGEFYLVFGELAPLDIDKDNPPDVMQIKPVAKIVVSPDKMLSIADAIALNVSNFKRKVGLPIKESEQNNDNNDS
jgi:hypothetical protein